VNYSEGQTLLSINNVFKTYNGKTVLKNVTANIKDLKNIDSVKGQVVGFLGPSGIGKSTLCRIIAGLETPDSGSVVLNTNTITIHAGDVGLVAQNYPLFPNRTVISNLMLAALRKTSNTKEAHDKVISYVNDFDLYAEINSYPAQLSGGQRQRASILQQILTRT
jgi:NitT/TauT family transport system ATP-binding protein